MGEAGNMGVGDKCQQKQSYVKNMILKPVTLHDNLTKQVPKLISSKNREHYIQSNHLKS